ncbi:class I glutamine amidotransferase-like protein [Aspergillus avenaceus]|uniref:Class I glutamine amidotransferase-like protein n=1 Tax=Aspergillus avenaceus TaxID=36643 RepID=A0A5N6U0D0_ASPAV|nr:class I glutamine amidotransferase-like protein [Aspergillus avenaceus]
MGSLSPLKIAILINNPPAQPLWTDIKNSYISSLAHASPDAETTFYDPISTTYPDPKDYDVIILSGGKADASSTAPWVLNELDFIRGLVTRYPNKKLVGMCFGHQAIARALGGEVRTVPGGPVAAVRDIRLTEAGREFFSFAAGIGSFRVPKFHVREVAKPAPGFVALAEDNECFVNERNTILSFQGHPEILNDFARKMLLSDDREYTENSTQGGLNAEVEKLQKPTDGIEILQRVVEWVRE